MSAQVDEVTAQAEGLAATAQQLRELVASFRLDQAGRAGSEAVPRRRHDDWQASSDQERRQSRSA